MANFYSEDRHVQETTAKYLVNNLKWNETIYAFTEKLGADGTLGRNSEKEIVLTKYLRPALERLNPKLPATAYEQAIQKITEYSISKDFKQINQEKYDLLRNGVVVEVKNENGEMEKKRLRVFDFTTPEANHFLAVRELWIQGDIYHRRADIIGFVNGIPLLFVELKRVDKDIRHAYDENFTDYKDTIPQIFYHNAFVILSNGSEAKIGSITSKYEHFHEWKRLEENETGRVDFETLLKGVCSKRNFMDLFENFILFDEGKEFTAKIVAKNHQFLGVNLAVESVRTRKERDGQLGVFWHTQGSGKSYSMVFFSEKVRRKLEGDFTFLVVTDRDDLDTQIYKTYAGCGIVNNQADKCRATSGDNLEDIVKMNKPYVFTMVQKFNKDVNPELPYSEREDIIVISDEAHRTQYGKLAMNMRNALKNAGFIGFTGTPLFNDDEVTKRIFGDYVSTYNFQRAVDDNATVPLYYDNRGEKLKIVHNDINEKIAGKIEQLEVEDEHRSSLERQLGTDYQVLTAKERLQTIAEDFVNHYSNQWQNGKAMFVCIDKLTTVKMFNLIQPLWEEKIKETERAIKNSPDEQEEIFLRNKLEWLKETQFAVVVSEEQNEVQKFRDWGLEITEHRKLIKNGFVDEGGNKKDIDDAFKNSGHPFRVAFICAMWLTGFDVPSLATLYLDKPLQAHTLMQAIARANRVDEGKNNGLVVDYCGILKNLRKALATFATGSKVSEEEVNPVKPADTDLLAELTESINEATKYTADLGFQITDLTEAKDGFDETAAINKAKEAINQNDKMRKQYEVLTNDVSKKFKSCVNIAAAYKYKKTVNALEIINKRLKDEKKKKDLSAYLFELQKVVDETIKVEIEPAKSTEEKIYDISRIDFERLKEEFKKSERKNTTVQTLKDVIEKRVGIMLKRNPSRKNLYERFQNIVNEYNKETDRQIIEMTFDELLAFAKALDDEEKRAMREELTEETLSLFDLLVRDKPALNSSEIKKLKSVSKELLEHLKSRYLNIQNWRGSEFIKGEVETFIHDFLYADETGLPPESFSIDEVKLKSDEIFGYIYQQYPNAESFSRLG